MPTPHTSPHTVVIGGGLAGLTAAATLARAGQTVTVLEAGEHLGGRARTRRRDGFELNLGPHALYRTAGGLGILRTLGVTVRGRLPRLDRAGVFAGGEVTPAFRHLRTKVTDRRRVATAMAGLGRRAASDWIGRPATEWLDEVTDDPAGRATLQSVIRTATYCADLERTDAAAVATQLRIAVRGVLYLHHGWSSLVEGLVDVILEAGGQLRTRASVEAVEHDEAVRAVRLADQSVLPADAVVIAVNDPRRAARLLHGAAATRLHDIADECVPVRMAHLDLALRPLPEPRFPAVLGIDAPLFLTVQSSVANVAPEDGAVLHVARYLRPGEEDGDHRPELEAFLDAAQPTWRDHVVDARYVPRSVVCADHARVATGGPTGRAAPDAAGVLGVTLAGDWVGPSALLADASILSGAAAAETVMTAMLDDMERQPVTA